MNVGTKVKLIAVQSFEIEQNRIAVQPLSGRHQFEGMAPGIEGVLTFIEDSPRADKMAKIRIGRKQYWVGLENCEAI